MKTWIKFKAWLLRTGLTKIGWLIGAIVSFIFGKTMLLGACVGIFLYINFNTLWKLTPWGKSKKTQQDG